MQWEVIKETTGTICTILSIILFIMSKYYDIKSNISANISTFIKDAQDYDNLTGPQKMDMVISWIKSFIPRAFSVLFNEKTLRQMAQNIYDDMRSYSETYVKSKTGLTIEKVEKIVEVLDDPQYKNKTNNSMKQE